MRKTLLLILTTFSLASCNHMAKKNDIKIPSAQPPVAKKINYEHKLHGDVRPDPYFWMRERDSKDVLDYIGAENNYYKTITKDASGIADTLFKEMKGRIKEDDTSVPYKKDNYYYYVRVEKGKEYPIYCRTEGEKGKEQVILDINELAKGQKYYSAALADISPNHEFAAYVVDNVGRRFYTIYFKNLKTGETLAENIPNTTGGWTWADNKTGFFSKQHPETLRADTVFRYTLGNKKPVKVFYEKDELFSVGVSTTRTGKYVFIETSSFDSSEFRYLPTSKPTGEFKVFLKREKNHEYGLIDGGDAFYVRTNWKAKNFRLVRAPYAKTAKANWKDVIKHRTKVYLEVSMVFKDFIATEARENGLVRIEILDRNTGKAQKDISFPDPAYVAGIGTNEEFETGTLRYNYSSLVQPDSVYDYDIKKQKSDLKKRKDVPTYNPDLYKSERQWATAIDGTKVPISLVYKKDLFKKGENPLFIYGYGSYGLSMDADFLSNIVSMLDRGFVFAIAHIRGGQELGRDWYEDGRMMNKKNTFYDFVSCTEHLVKEGYGKAGHVYAEGGSAGGLLMGAVVNLRPDLYRGIHAAVPFVDVLTTMLDTSIPLTVAEYEQWGNPNQKKAYEYMKSYSPYDNVTEKKYPNVLVTTGYHDSQVQYWEPLKWTAKLRENNTNNTVILMRTELGAGHSGVTGRFARTKEVAEDYSFFVWLEGLK